MVVEFGNHPDPKLRINNGTPRVLTVDDALSQQRPDLVVRLLDVVARAVTSASAKRRRWKCSGSPRALAFEWRRQIVDIDARWRSRRR